MIRAAAGHSAVPAAAAGRPPLRRRRGNPIPLALADGHAAAGGETTS